MTVKDLIVKLGQLPEDAQVFVSDEINPSSMPQDPVLQVGRMIIDREFKNSGGRVIAGVIFYRCEHP
jgi:hypothetical protein